MKKSHCVYQHIVLLMLCFLIPPNSGYAQNVVRVGIVMDGPAAIFDELQKLFVGEITALTEGEFDIRFDTNKTVNGSWSIPEIQLQLDKLQIDPAVDVVLALGFVSSLVASRSENLRKPTFAPLVLDSNLIDLPRDGDSSGVRNLNYLTEEVRFTDDVEAFRDIVDFKKLVLLLDKTIYDSVPELAASGLQWAEELDIELQYVLNDTNNEDLAAKIPPDAEAVMVAALPRLDASSRNTLIRDLLARKLPTYSLIGTTPVRKGMLAATAPDSDWQRLARRNALNIQSVLIGETAGAQPVAFRHKRQLTINMETARQLDIYPRFDILSSAELINEDPNGAAVTWSLSTVAREAVESNLELQASEAGLRANAELQIQAESALRPQFNTSIGITQLNNSGIAVQSGQAAERTTTAALSLNKILYSESALAAIKVQHHIQQARVSAHQQLRLNVVQNATIGFLNILKSQTLVNINRRSLRLSRTNLDLAQDRVDLGSSNASDVYRWESEVATSRQDLLAAQAQLQQAMDALNRTLNRPITERFETTPASLDDTSLLVSRTALSNLIDNQRAFNVLGEIFVSQGIENSPEIQELMARLAATERQLSSNRNSFWSPQINLTGQLSNTIDEDDALTDSQEGESDWQFALNLTLPLYQGGQRRSKVSQETYNLHQLELQKQDVENAVEQSVRANLHAVQSTFPSMELAGVAADSARKNLELVQDNYNNGSRSIIDFLDARDASLNADQRAINAVYDFLIDLMNLQRSTASFDFFLDQQTLDNLAQDIMTKITN